MNVEWMQIYTPMSPMRTVIHCRACCYILFPCHLSSHRTPKQRATRRAHLCLFSSDPNMKLTCAAPYINWYKGIL